MSEEIKGSQYALGHVVTINALCAIPFSELFHKSGYDIQE